MIGPHRAFHVARRPCGFTLVEMLVSMVILIVILVVGFNLLNQTAGIWQRSIQQVQAFQSARLGFDLVTRDLSQSTLNTYLEYIDGQAAPGPYFASETSYNTRPARYVRKSDLHFVCAYSGLAMVPGGSAEQQPVPGTIGTGTSVFFQAPLGYTAPYWTSTTSGTPDKDDYNGLPSILNAVGYFVEFGPDTVLPAHVTANAVNQKHRYRLKQLLIPSDRDTIYPVYRSTVPAYDPKNPSRWFTGTNLTRPDDTGTGSPASNVHPVADNILALVVRVEDPAAPDLTGTTHPYLYDSHLGERLDPQPLMANQMPPVVQVTMVAIDEISALRMNSGTTEPAAIRTLLNKQVNGKARFADLTHYADDLADLEEGLLKLRINYRVFSTAVPVRESKWTK